MCGISGYLALDFDTDCRESESILSKMTGALKHRGPDEEGYYHGPGVCFGFSRLAIVDLETGQQPHYNEDRSIVCICNGEIYNYPELRADLLGRGHKFRGQSDVEVLVHLYEEKGEAFVERLRGQFAFALYDSKRKVFLAARDHVGICPFFYSIHEGSLIFASEVKALLQYPGFCPSIDPRGLDQLLTFPGLVSPQTMFLGVSSLPAGHLLKIVHNEAEVHEYWDLNYPLATESLPVIEESVIAEQLRELLITAVERRLQADVPVGFYLSGGLDSSLVARLIHQLQPEQNWDCFSIGFNQSQIDERHYQSVALAGLNVRQNLAVFDWQQISARLPGVIWHSETPLKESYNTCSLALSEMVKNADYKVVLTGEGADELFGGYAGYRLDKLRKPSLFPDPEQLLERDVRNRLWGDEEFIYERDYYAFRELKDALYSSDLSASLDEIESTQKSVVNLDKLAGRDTFHKRSYIDFKLRIADHLLADHGDRAAMANSVEARYPFLDIDLIDYVRSIPPSMMIRGGVEKHLLKRAAQGLVPQPILNREKFAFVAPGSDYLLRNNPEFVQDYLSCERVKRENYFDPVTVERLKKMTLEEGFSINQTFDNDLLMVVLTFSIFLDQFNS